VEINRNLAMRTFPPGDPIRWLGLSGVILRAIEVDDGYAYGIDLH
jgi:hypothetical protein